MNLMKAFYLGETGYNKALKLQEKLVKWTKEVSPAHSTVLLLQHNPVYTVGLRDKTYTPEDEIDLTHKGAEFIRTNRGGLITFHGPGQLVCYPIFNAKAAKLGPRQYICNLEKSVINLCKRYGLTATTSEDTGVWIRNDKICAIGINAQQRIYSHGIALNCNCDMTWFEHIVPCGLVGKGVTSLSKKCDKDVTVEDVYPRYCREMSNIFKWDFDEIVKLDDENISSDNILKVITS